MIHFKVLFVVLLLSFWTNSSIAQPQRNLDRVKTIIQTAYNYSGGAKNLTLVKKSEFDTNQVLVLQHRYNYMKVDTGFAVRAHYQYMYQAKSKLGNYYSENLEHSSKPNKKYTKQESSFRSYDDKHKRKWVKLFKKNSSLLLRQTEKTFDENGYVTSTKTTNYNTSPPSTFKENVSRNKSGNMTHWESFDDDGDIKMQARSFDATYKNDTILLSSRGYLYHNWNEVINKYDKKNQLRKTISNTGIRQSTGKIKRKDQVVVLYKENKPYKSVAKKLSKLAKTILFVYEEGKEIQQITTTENTYEEVKTYEYLDSTQLLLTKYTETLDSKPFLKKEITYDSLSFQITSYTEIEVRKNGSKWKTIKEYNRRGNLIRIRFYIADILNKEDVYKYTYQYK
jgi:hypothetical protein